MGKTAVLLRYLAPVDSLLAPGPCANGPHDRQGWPRASFKKLSSERLKVFLGLPALRHRQRRGAARHGMRRRTGIAGRLQPHWDRRKAPAAVRAFHSECRLVGRLTLGFRESLAGARQHSRAASALRGGVLAVGAARVAAFSALVVRILPLVHTRNCRAQERPESKVAPPGTRLRIALIEALAALSCVSNWLMARSTTRTS